MIGFHFSSKMLAILSRFLTTLAYAVVGLILALPISYWFQSSIYHEMTWLEYIRGGFYSLRIGAQFGAFDVYRYSMIASVLVSMIIGRVLEWYFFEKKKTKGI